jgi:hypothetical protein
VTPRTHAETLSLAGGALLAAAGLLLLANGGPYGSLLMLAAFALVGAFSRRWLPIALLLTLPSTNVGWDLSLFTIASRSFDARLALTFGIAVLVATFVLMDLIRDRGLTRLEWVMAAFVGYVVIDGALRSQSVYVWAPYAARWTAYFGAFALARRHITTPQHHLVLVWATVAGFAVPCAYGLWEFASGHAVLVNGALRATSLGAAGPIALAFAGQMVVLLAVLTFPRSRGAAIAALAFSLVGGAAVIASATRTVVATLWLGLVGPLAIRRRWQLAGLVTLLALAALVVRPDFLSRFTAIVPDVIATPTQSMAPNGPAPEATPSPSGQTNPDLSSDASFRYRLFVWNTILGDWTRQPVLGIGPGMTANVIAEVSEARRSAPHNDYIGVLAELGLMGAVLFVAIQALVVWNLLGSRRGRFRRTLPNFGNPRSTALVVFAAFNVLGALNNPMYFLDLQVGIWSLVGAACAAWRIEARTTLLREERLAHPETVTR